MPLIGTAGHIDHGKSTLVRALSGIDPSRLPEERARGMTIDLGYAYLNHPDGYRLGIVDVPGHETLVRNMVAGATGFDVALWVVDAAEGVMPQSREHLRILELLGMPMLLPVITKAELATATRIDATAAEIAALLRGTVFAEAPLHIVDSHTGRGIDLLRDAIFDAAGGARARAAQKGVGEPYLPIDRVFSARGIGTVLTGTLVRGRLAVGDQLRLASQPDVPLRIRSLHQHHAAVATSEAGDRVGVNLAGRAPDAARRGDVLVGPAHPYRARFVNVRLQLLSQASGKPRHGGRMLFYAGCTEVECRLWGVSDEGAHCWAQIELPRELSFHSEQRFILRTNSPLTTVGGGQVVDIAPDRRRRVTSAERTAYAARTQCARYLEAYVGERGCPCDVSALATRWMVRPEDLLRDAAEAAALRVRRGDPTTGAPALVWHVNAEPELIRRLGEALRGATERTVSFGQLGRALGTAPEHVPPLLAALLERDHPTVAALRETVRLDRVGVTLRPGSIAFTPQERQRAEAILSRLLVEGLRPSRVDDLRRAFPERPQLTDRVLARLRESGRVVPVSPELLLHPDAATALRAAPVRHGLDGVRAAEFGQALGLSRKYGIPYLEWLNREGVMRREGDRHFLVRGDRAD